MKLEWLFVYTFKQILHLPIQQKNNWKWKAVLKVHQSKFVFPLIYLWFTLKSSFNITWVSLNYTLSYSEFLLQTIENASLMGQSKFSRSTFQIFSILLKETESARSTIVYVCISRINILLAFVIAFTIPISWTHWHRKLLTSIHIIWWMFDTRIYILNIFSYFCALSHVRVRLSLKNAIYVHFHFNVDSRNEHTNC